MTDEQMTFLCAQAMGIPPVNFGNGERYVTLDDGSYMKFDPLRNDRHAMELIKKLGLDIHCRADMNGWYVGRGRLHEGLFTNADLNRAICECAAKIQQEAQK